MERYNVVVPVQRDGVLGDEYLVEAQLRTGVFPDLKLTVDQHQAFRFTSKLAAESVASRLGGRVIHLYDEDSTNG